MELPIYLTFNFDVLITFCFGVSSNLSQEKSQTVEILDIYFSEQLFGENICLKFPLLVSFLVIILKKLQSRKWSTYQSFKKFTLEFSIFWKWGWRHFLELCPSVLLLKSSHLISGFNFHYGLDLQGQRSFTLYLFFQSKGRFTLHHQRAKWIMAKPRQAVLTYF